MSLNDRQRDELHNALLEYLLGRDEFAEAANVFQRAAGITAPPAGAAPGRGLLEKKWTSVVRLQKKVMDLEAQLAQAERDPARDSKPGHAPSAFNGASQGIIRASSAEKAGAARARVRRAQVPAQRAGHAYCRARPPNQSSRDIAVRSRASPCIQSSTRQRLAVKMRRLKSGTATVRSSSGRSRGTRRPSSTSLSMTRATC